MQRNWERIRKGKHNEAKTEQVVYVVKDKENSQVSYIPNFSNYSIANRQAIQHSTMQSVEYTHYD